MNILPTGPHVDFDLDYDRYFADLKRWNFDVAYNAHYAFSLRDVTGKLEEPYCKFSRRARSEGVRSCIQIQSTVANTDDVPLSETQRYADNQYYIYEHFEGEGKKNHFGSFASQAWLEHLMRLTKIFRDYGFDWVVFEEPMLITDIPGPDDPMAAEFRRRFPTLSYPTHQAETREYLALQRLKRDTMTRFYESLTSYAKNLGFEMVGIMPWFFTPTFENTPPETWSTSCDTGRLTFLGSLDFIVVRMQPDNISAQAMIAATGESRPTLAYYECLAHALGKPIIMVNNPTDEHRPEWSGAKSLIPYGFFRRYTLAAAAAAPQGMSRHWYGKDYDQDARHMDLLAEVNDVLRRLGPARCDVAFVFSFSGASHVWPRPWREVWRVYWTFAEEVTERARLPFLTFFAESLDECLESHPEVKVLVLNEFFPLPEQEIHLLEFWVRSVPGRRIIYIGGRDGYTWDGPLHTEYRMRPPEMSRLAGIDPGKPVRMAFPDPDSAVEFVGQDGETAILGGRFCATIPVVGLPQFSEKAEVEVIYRIPEAENAPVICRRRFSGGGEAWFVATALEGRAFDFPIGRFLRVLTGARRPDGAPLLRARVVQASSGTYFNFTRTGYFVASNCTGRPAEVTFEAPLRAWDVSAERLVEGLQTLQLEPLSLGVFRILKKGGRLLDVRRAVLILAVKDSPEEGTVRVRGRFHWKCSLWLIGRPQRVSVNGRGSRDEHFHEKGEGVWEIFLDVTPGAICEIVVKF